MAKTSAAPGDGFSTRQLVESFLQWCARHRKPATFKHYRDRLTSFVRKFGARSFQEITPLEIDEWLYEAGHWPTTHKTKAGQPKAPDTRRANIITFERLQQWAVENKLLEKPITGKLEKPRGRLRERVPTDAEMAAILKLASNEFALIYQALRQCGARPNELCRATLEDWDRTEGVIRLSDHKTATKTGKPRIIAVGEHLEQTLKKSLGRRQSGHLFRNAAGKPWTPARLSEVFRALRDRAGLPKDLCLYLTRHWHATQLCQAGVNLFEVAQALGHSDTHTTERYLHTTPERLKGNQDKVA